MAVLTVRRRRRAPWRCRVPRRAPLHSARGVLAGLTWAPPAAARAQADEERNTLAAEEDDVRRACDALRAEVNRLRARAARLDEQRSKAALRHSAMRSKVDAAHEAVERSRACNEELEQEGVRRATLLDQVQEAEAGSDRAAQRLRDLKLVTQRYQRERDALRHAERERDLAEQLLQRLGGALGFDIPGDHEPLLQAPPSPPPPPPPPQG